MACERDLRPLKLAQQAFEKAGVADKVLLLYMQICDVQLASATLLHGVKLTTLLPSKLLRPDCHCFCCFTLIT